jgi:CBS domain-containing membrane protein
MKGKIMNPSQQIEKTHPSLSDIKAMYSPKVRDLMTPDPVSLTPSDSVKTLIDLMHWKSIRHVPITNVENQVIGLVSHRDFLTIAVSRLADIPPHELDGIYSTITIEHIMGRKVMTTTPDANLSDAAQLMFAHKYGCLPVVEEGKLVGILTESDFVRAFVEREAKFH